MWTLSNRTPYAVERNWVRDRTGAHRWIVAVKASFDLSPKGALTLSEEQPPPALAPVHFGAPGLSSLRFDADLGLKKPGTDVVVNAHAHAPGGKAAPSVPVALTVGARRKVLLVHGDRIYVPGGSTSAARPFVTRPIRYEFAFGGTDLTAPDAKNHVLDLRNPVGRGVAYPAKKLAEKLAHVIEYPTGEPRTQGPAGYGAIDSWWEPRRRYAGTYDERWERDKKPFLPDDYDERFALSAPPDQCTQEYLRGGERVELVHMTPEGRLSFALPKLGFAFETMFSRRKEEHRADLVSVILEPEEHKVMMVWQTDLQVASRDCDYLDQTVIREDGRA